MTELEPKHELLHSDSPTWCLHCGTYDIYCADSVCDVVDREARAFDTRLPGRAERMFCDTFGYPRETAEQPLDKERP